MKYLLIALLLTGCSTLTPAQKSQAEQIAAAALDAAAQVYGLPITSAQVQSLAGAQLWGASSVTQAGQPAASGTTVPAIGNAIAANVPPMITPDQEAALLAAAAKIAQK